jgi:divalent metal cation (Fe/Co/Zn/Cd) transporter
MKKNINLKPLFVSIILILAGIISPSNGLDDAIHKSPYQILSTIFIVIISAVSIYLLWSALENYKKTSKSDS